MGSFTIIASAPGVRESVIHLSVDESSLIMRRQSSEELLGISETSGQVIVTARGSRIIDSVVKRCFNIAHDPASIAVLFGISSLDESSFSHMFITVDHVKEMMSSIIEDCVIEPIRLATGTGGRGALITLAYFVRRLGLSVDVRQVDLDTVVSMKLDNCLKPPDAEKNIAQHAVNYALDNAEDCLRELIDAALDTLERSEVTEVLAHGVVQ